MLTVCVCVVLWVAHIVTTNRRAMVESHHQNHFARVRRDRCKRFVTRVSITRRVKSKYSNSIKAANGS